ncbi:MAG: hypothetical protein ACON5N_17750 [Akkermansiaceae bacterium]
MFIRLLLVTLLLGPVAAVLTSCAAKRAASTESTLSAAGFKIRTPENAKQQAIYDQLPDYKIQRGKHEGKIFYAYKDEKQGVAYVGGEDEYQKYQQLATQRNIARDRRMAAEMQGDMSYRWYGAYHPFYGPYF